MISVPPARRVQALSTRIPLIYRIKEIPTYESFEAILADKTVSLVTVAVPNHLHKDICTPLMEAGKHVVCEKLVALNSAELQEMIDTANRCGVLFTVHQNHRWDEDFLVLKKLLRENTLGNIFGIESRVHGPRGIPGDWRNPKQFGGGMVLEKANKLKLVAYVCGSVANIVTDEMYAKGVRIVSGNEAFAISVAEGTMAHILASQRHFYEYDCRAIEGGWKTSATATMSLLGKTVGIVGLGSIAKYLLTMLKPFNVKVKLNSNHTTAEKAAEMGVQKADLEEIFSTCDIVSVH